MYFFVLKRLLLLVPSMVGLLVLSFFMVTTLPADPAVALAGENATPEQVQKVREEFGFDKPFHVQAITYLRHVAHGEFGVSNYTRRPVVTDLLDRIPATLELAVVSILISVVFGIPLGVWAAVEHNRWPDHLMRLLTVAGFGIASFWLALMLQLTFAMDLRLLPLTGRLAEGLRPPPTVTGFLLVDSVLAGNWPVLWSALQHLALPAITLSVAGITTIARFTRAGMLEVLQHEYINYARAAGYPERRIVWLYALRPAITPAVTQIGLLFGAVIAGSVVVETIFVWPGIGTYVAEAILAVDYKPMLAITLLIGVIYALVNVAVEIVVAIIDPRMRE